MQTLAKLRPFPLLALSAALLLTTAGPAAAAKFDTPWVKDYGDGVATVVGTGVNSDPEYAYTLTNAWNGMWKFDAIAGSTRSIPVKWHYTGTHTGRVGIERFVLRNGAQIVLDPLAGV